MTPKQIDLVQESWKKVLPIATQAAEIFYQKLFALDPALKPLFKSNMSEQGNKLMTMLDTAVKLLNSPEKLVPAVQKLGARHVHYGVKESHYDTVGAALLDTLAEGLGDDFTLSVKRAWTAVYGVLAKTMIDAAKAEQKETPPLTINNSTITEEPDMENKANKNDLAVRLQGALDQSATAFMMIDREFIINYVNEATLSLLAKHEEVFQMKWPSFSAEKSSVLGTCIDGFHKNPEHQRKLLDDPSNLPWKTDVNIEFLTFELNVSAINDSEGNYIGNSMEWKDVTDVRMQANKAIQLQGAVEQSNTPSMMIDRDLNITYANPATFTLLKKHEATFQIKYPGFSSEPGNVIGVCIDGFHKNPAHQRKLLDDPSNLPWKTDINIEHLIFELNVTAINDASGKYIGNSMEWNDVTDARAQANKAVQLQGAVEQSNTPSMMIDRDFLITYANPATFALLSKHEATFQIKYPGFSSKHEAVIGACIDGFHKNPAHQRKLLDDPSNLPWKTDIKIEHLTFELNVTAINDASGKYIGNSMEWNDVTEIRSKAIEVGRLTSAVNGMTTNLMMAETTGKIVYCNPSVLQMLRRREVQLRTVLPSFNVDRVVGTNFDSFHKNPAHQQNLLGNPANLPFDTEIKVAGLTFQLIAIALLDENKNHVGTAVQWLDLTEQKDGQAQVESLISAAIDGDLGRRIDTKEYQGFMKSLGENINNLMDTIVEPITDAINIAQALSEGDLTKTMDGKYGGEFLALANAMNGSIENLSNMVEEIRDASTNVFDAAREIAAGNDELSHRTESQASSLEETASAMEELTSTVQQNAENSSDASMLASSVMEKASSGGEVVKNAIQAMSDINKSSKKIADIISVIDEIAFQTNLLALNAAVEAARAGEQGRGFAVVAAEVRNLAQRSAGAAKEIKGLINDSVEAVGQGTKLVDETGQTFTDLVNSISDVSKMIADIDAAGKEQSAGIGEVSAAVSQMDEMTQQNAALVEEASASSKSMEEQAQGLLEQVDFFTVNEEEPEPEPKPRRRARKPVGKPVQKPTASRRPARRATESDQEWEEF
ncbi:methyl-accepting chemotaxis protein [Colwellia sp. PAMC 20917]|uniref:methyl-accepting chemotaxis protein n=1 Tax=Colwellia sp. PAMC 20917 TaxID=1816218 RepID=UPI0009F23C43|nr:methyl-accepting chemotaxis protein [Colwellia sp. PAMC 20917]